MYTFKTSDGKLFVIGAAAFRERAEHIVLIGDQCFDPVAGSIETLRTVVA